MRFLIRLLVLAAIVFCGWWALASYGVSQAIDTWAADRRAEGWQVEAQTSQGGFPFNIATQINAVAMTGGNSGFSTQGARVAARTWWPGHVDVDLPESPVVFTDGAARTSFQTAEGAVALRLRPGLALELGSADFGAESWVLRAEETPLMSGGSLTLTAQQDSDADARYNLVLNAEGLTPGAVPRQLLSLPDTWPQAFDSFTARGAVTFDGPLNRSHLEGPRPQFRQITLTEAVIIWGALSLNGSGALDVDAAGVPTGNVTLQAKDWRGLLDIAQQAGALPAKQRGQAELMLGLLAGRSGDADNLDMDVVFASGRMSVSGIPLGPAPRIVWP